MSRTPPVRMCIGCRERATKSELLRVVVVDSGPISEVVPDGSAKRAGRGASLHPTSACLDLAERRRAFPRAFRLEGPLDISPLRTWIEARVPGGSSPED